jgi:hypothetical protein
MAEATENEVEYADYYQCTAGFTVGVNVCAEGEVLEGSAMGFSESNPPLSEEDQLKQYGQVMYKEYEPEEDEDLVPIQHVSRSIRALQGMQSPDMPPVEAPTLATEAPLFTLSRQELRKKAKRLGLNFPEDTDREQMIGAIEKKEKENAEGEGDNKDENEIVAKRREHAREVIEENNAMIASGGNGGGGSAPRRSRAPRQEAPPEEEQPRAE